VLEFRENYIIMKITRIAKDDPPELSPTAHGFIDECIKKNKDKEDPGAYCAAIVDRAKGTTDWRKGPRESSSEDWYKEAQKLENVEEKPTFTERELVRAIRDAIIGEEGAINQYETIVDSTKNQKVAEVLQGIADEEKVHVGELQRLLNILLKDEEEFLEEGAQEVDGVKEEEADEEEVDEEEVDEKESEVEN